MATKLKNFVNGEWVEGSEAGVALYNAVTGEHLFNASTKGIDFKGMVGYAHKHGNKLRSMTFHERARMIKALALHLNERKKDFYSLSAATGATKSDSWVDIDGGIGNLFVCQ